MRFQKSRAAVFLTGLTAVFLLFGIAGINPQSVDAADHPGMTIYQTNCADCHGQKGDSKGFVCFNTKVEPTGRQIVTYSRDFTAGVFKFRTTSTGCLPLETDLEGTLKRGIAPSFMPSFQDLSDKQQM
jgi:hypothetical protein